MNLMDKIDFGDVVWLVGFEKRMRCKNFKKDFEENDYRTCPEILILILKSGDIAIQRLM